MQKIKSIAFALVIGIAAVSLPVAPASATVIWNVDGTGQLTGAQNVNVGGTLYDVTFADGSCATLFTGCNNTADFDFTDAASAASAAQALLDQVFINSAQGSFDSNPSLTLGCTTSTSCGTLIPYALNGTTPTMAEAINDTVPTKDKVLSNTLFSQSLPATIFPASTFATFTSTSPAAIPEPGTLLIFAVGLASLAGFGRRRRRG